MENNQIVSSPGLMGKKIIFGILGLIVIAEILWVGKMIYYAQNTNTAPPPALIKSASTEITLTSSKNEIKVGEEFNVDINILSSATTDGVDLIISFDPALLSITDTVKPVTTGTIYVDYPFNAMENGKITVSGISSATSGIIPNGLFGSIAFQAKAVGLAKIAVDFTPNNTKDSNIIESETGQDILEKVTNLELNILP